MATVERRQLVYLGYVLKGDGVERDCLLGMIGGKKARGRQRMKYMESKRWWWETIRWRKS